MYLLTEKLTSTVIVWMIIKRVLKPWDKWDAAKYGIISSVDGKRLRRPKTSKEHAAWDILDRFCWSIKRLCTRYLNDSQFAYLFSIAYLMKEKGEIIFNANKEKYLCELESLTTETQQLFYNIFQQIEKETLISESKLDVDSNIFKILPKVATILKEYKVEKLFEEKQVGIIYHYTSYLRMGNICKTDMLIQGNIIGYSGVKAISLTRDKMFHRRHRGDMTISTDVRITLDGNKLSRKYKIVPYHDLYFYDNKSAQHKYDEMEERINIDKINDIHKYILKIEFLKRPFYIQDNEAIPIIIDFCYNYNIPLIDIPNKKIISEDMEGTSLGDIAQFTPILGINKNRINKRIQIKRRYKNVKHRL